MGHSISQNDLRGGVRVLHQNHTVAGATSDTSSKPAEKETLQRTTLMPLDPQVRDFLDRLAAANLPPIQEQPVAEARRQMDLSTHFLGPLPRVDRVEDRLIPGTRRAVCGCGSSPPECQRPRPRPVLVYFHGGGWVLGNIDSHEGICRALANAAGVTVVSVDYRLAPEHRFPAAAEDAYAAVTWVAASCRGVRGRPRADRGGRRQHAGETSRRSPASWPAIAADRAWRTRC